MYLGTFLSFNPSASTVYARCTFNSQYAVLIFHFAPSVLLSVCGLHFTLSLHFTPGPQSAVLSLRFTLTGLIISIYSSALTGASKETEQSSD